MHTFADRWRSGLRLLSAGLAERDVAQLGDEYLDRVVTIVGDIERIGDVDRNRDVVVGGVLEFGVAAGVAETGEVRRSVGVLGARAVADQPATEAARRIDIAHRGE